MTTREATKAQSVEELEAKAEQVAHEVETLEQQLKAARTQIARAQTRFAELDNRRKELAPRTFAGDEKAREELEDLEDTHDQISRSVRVAKAAEPALQRMVEEAKSRLKAARRVIQEAKASALSEQIQALNPERDAAADQLAEVLERQSKLRSEMISEVNAYDQDAANSLLTTFQSRHGNWIKQRFLRWL